MRSLHRRWLVDIITFYILPSQIIGQDEHDIWLGRPVIGKARKSKHE
jgi:hypothetical protein